MRTLSRLLSFVMVGILLACAGLGDLFTPPVLAPETASMTGVNTSTNGGVTTTSLTYSSSEPATAITAHYAKALAADGWTVVETEGMVSATGERGAVTITTEDGGFTVTWVR
ncbi:MAG: hypothetical protein KC656_18420 [Myxococcales bacterium]|nr:hypothetical protein [Myxococcales bacterium]MCB9672122.1 hypothetical protein [Alphaproteobacteria bacterium]MCB9691575.1 hypothetical protein [Alphaproteobacteria bacterium]